MNTNRDFDVAVIGGGHAGVEAALAAARMGARTVMVVLSVEAVGRMSCNPAIGGIGKGQLVREVDALGGEMGRAADASGIHFRMLNTKKGPAVQAPRAQCDRQAYGAYMLATVQAQAGLELLEGEAVEVLRMAGSSPAGAGRIQGLRLADGSRILAPAVVLTTGTFLGGRLFSGAREEPGGRYDERAASLLSGSLRALGLRLGRHKTGTPPRLLRESIDFSRLQVQPGDRLPRPFSFRSGKLLRSQLPCHLTRTGEATHRLIREHVHLSPMARGRIVGKGPRYCPSIEDKVLRFPQQQSHLVFLEPEGLQSDQIYPNGISTSLPAEVQATFLATIEGLEEAVMLRPGYAVEYDHLCTDQIRADLRVAELVGLYAAGQINGTSGYEEAAGQGIIAGINAVRFLRRQEPVLLSRASSYIGVMIDDLCRVNPTEPYRMFSSRAEFRLLLRSENADRRLMPLGRELGLVEEGTFLAMRDKEEQIRDLRRLLAETRGVDGRSLETRLRRPEQGLEDLVSELPGQARELGPTVFSEVEAEVKYEGYIKRQEMEVERLRRMEAKQLPRNLDYGAITGLSAEARDLLGRRRPMTLGEAGRIPGVRASDLNLLLALLAGRRRAAAKDDGSRAARPGP